MKVDDEARRAIREALDTTLVVEAAAGTGKTTELVARMVALLKAGRASMGSLIAVTFTEKAAGEMKLRLRSALGEARAGAAHGTDEAARLDRALLALEEARIGTIHGLCADLLRERPIEAGLDPLFQVAPEPEAARLFDRAFGEFFERVRQQPPEGIRRLLRRRPRRKDDGGARELLRRAAWQWIDRRDFDAPWTRPSLDRETLLDQAFQRAQALARILAHAQPSPRTNRLLDHLREVERFVGEIEHKEKVAPRDLDGLEAGLRELSRHRGWTWKGSGEPFAPRHTRAEVLALREEVKRELDDTLERLDADLAACLQTELQPLLPLYAQYKRLAGRLDFFDLLAELRGLLAGSAEVRAELQRRFTHLFVDEFQDTDPLQAEILLLLAADNPEVSDFREANPVPGKLFVVGDPKQSIYRFRRADVRLYEEVKRLLVQRGARLVHLSTSFRSTPQLQSAINAAFAPRMNPRSLDGASASQASYVPLAPHRPDTFARPSLVALPVPRPYADFGAVTGQKIEESLPEAVGAFVDFLVNHSGWRVPEARGDGTEEVPLAPRHICLLFKRFQSFGRHLPSQYARALEARGIAHQLVGGRSFHAREELLALRNALAAIEWPDDELRVFAALKGPLFALGDDALLAFKSAVGKLHPLRRRQENDAGVTLSPLCRDVEDALAVLGELHRRRNRRPLVETLSRLLEATRGLTGMALWSTGEQALANTHQLLELARRFETNGATSFRAFVERLEESAESGTGEATATEEDSDGVRLMTVHKAKGLEFPVVILCDPTAPATSSAPSRYLDTARRLWAEPLAGCAPSELLAHREEALRHDEEEALRLLYVAATRARDLLVVPTCGDGPLDGWLSPLNPVLYPPSQARRSPAPAPACPPFGSDTVLDRPMSCNASPRDAVAPGLHRPEAGEHRVVWWDPSALELGSARGVGLRLQELLEAPKEAATLPSSEDANEGSRAPPKEGTRATARAATDESAGSDDEAWRATRSALIQKASLPAVQLCTVREAAALRAASPEVGMCAFPVEQTEVPRHSRSRGPRFGALVHAILAQIHLDTSAADLRALAAHFARLSAATPQEQDDACAAASAALAHPRLKRALSRPPEHLLREEPLWLQSPGDPRLVEGVIDLAYFEPDSGWTVVELKTDAELDPHLPQYRAQLGLYVDAVARATGQETTGVLFWL